MKLRTKIILPLLFLLCLLIGTFVYLFVHFRNSGEVVQNNIETVQQVNDLTTRILLLRHEIEHNVMSYRLDRNKQNISVIEQNQKEINFLLEKIRPYLKTEAEKELLFNFERTRQGLIDARTKMAAAMEKDDMRETDIQYNTWQTLLTNSNAALLDLTNYNLHSFERTSQVFRDLLTRIYMTVIVITLITAILIISLFIYLRTIITRPVEELTETARDIARGNFSRPMVIRSGDEMGILASNLDAMARALKENYISLEKEIRRKEAEIRKNKLLEKQKDEFLSIASHELKTPITSVKVYAQVLAQQFDKAGDIKSAALARKMDSQVNKLTYLISDLLDVTKIQAGKLQFSEKDFDLNTLVDEITEQMQLVTKHHTIRLDLGRTVTVSGDRDRIGQVIINLLSNAIAYSPQADTVSVRSRTASGLVTLSVYDSGIGIPRDKIKRIFQRYYRVDDGRKDKVPGLGLGLYISHEIIKRHGGTMQVESEQGKGSTFSFTLPIRKRQTGNA